MTDICVAPTGQYVRNSIWIHSLSFEPECDCQIIVSVPSMDSTESYESRQRWEEEEEDVCGTNGKCIYFMFQCKRNIVNMGKWVARERGLFWDCHEWLQREVWARKLYQDTQWELCWAVWDGLNWTEVHYKCQQTMSTVCALWRNVSHCACQWGGRFSSGLQRVCRTLGVGVFCMCVYLCVACMFWAQIVLFPSLNGWHRCRILFPLLEVPWKATETMREGNYISCGLREKSRP